MYIYLYVANVDYRSDGDGARENVLFQRRYFFLDP